MSAKRSHICGIRPKTRSNTGAATEISSPVHLIALADRPAPEGHDHWILRLLANKTVELGFVEPLFPETVSLRWKNALKSWRKQQKRAKVSFKSLEPSVAEPVDTS